MALYNPYNVNQNYGYYQQQQFQQPMNQAMYNMPQNYQQPQYNNARMVRGRVVDNINEVMANEVSLDGSVSVFPVADLSCIYAKVWTGDGSIKTFKFVPELAETPAQKEKENVPALINERFDRLEKLIASKNQNAKFNKEGAKNE